MTTATAIQTANTLLTLIINSLAAFQQAQLIIEAARSEGREVSDEELARIRDESAAKTRDTLAVLDSLGT